MADSGIHDDVLDIQEAFDDIKECIPLKILLLKKCCCTEICFVPYNIFILAIVQAKYCYRKYES